MTNQKPLSSCCQAPVADFNGGASTQYGCTSCGKPCTVNASAVEEFVRDFCRDTPRVKPESGVAFYERLLRGVSEFSSTLSDSTLREVLVEIGEDEKHFEFECNGHYESFCEDKNCPSQANQKMIGRNAEKAHIRDIINNHLEK